MTNEKVGADVVDGISGWMRRQALELWVVLELGMCWRWAKDIMMEMGVVGFWGWCWRWGLELDRGGAGWRRGLAGYVGLVLVVCVVLELDWCWRWASDGGWGIVGVEGGMGLGMGRGRDAATAHADHTM
jgi:hypothetical protein